MHIIVSTVDLPLIGMGHSASISIRVLGVFAIAIPLFGILFSIFWTILYDLEEAVRTVCHVPNILPTLSAAIGGFTPQKYVWRICITLQAGLRFALAFCYYNWHLRLYMGPKHRMYQHLVQLTIFCHMCENMALVILSSVSSSENGDIHENAFIVFMVCSQIYMLLSCGLITWTQKSGIYEVSNQEKCYLRWKTSLFVFNLVVFLVSVYYYFRHNAYCEPYIYSFFALGEYLTIFSNIAFHGMCCGDFQDYTFTFLPSEDVKTGVFKNR